MGRDNGPRRANPLVKQYGQPFVPPADTPPDSWLLRPELPEASEVWNCNADKTPPDNYIDKPWKSKEDYLRAHYELLREDTLRGLRDAIREVRMMPQMGDSNITSIYDKVYVTGYTLSHQGPAAQLIFSTRRAGKRIRWHQSKRLLAGTLVALTPAADMFQSRCVMAVVAARPLSGVQRSPPEVDIFFTKPSECVVDPTEQWVMVEAKSGYFESVRHTLVGLQRLTQESFPLSEHLVHLEKSIPVPDHMVKNPIIDLSSLTKDEASRPTLTHANVLESFPHIPKPSLDESQLQAVQRMLTKRLAIVQGPPGTGKTHVSVALLQLLLNRLSDDDPPILVVSHTNHALDQMLRHVMRYEDKFIRLGSRTSDEEIEKHTLFKARRRRSPPDLEGSSRKPAWNRLDRLHDKMSKALEPLIKRNEPFSADELHRLGLLRDAQRRSLEEDGKDWVVHHRSVPVSSPMIKWLATELVSVDQEARMLDDDYRENGALEFEDSDLEGEQPRELEADSGAIEDDIEGLSGPWRPIKRQMALHQRYGISTRTVQKALDMDDLWNVPQNVRAPVYLELEKRAMAMIGDSFRKEAEEYVKVARDMRLGSWESDSVVLERAKIVGMTATGLGKYRPLIASVRPKIMIVEEAAETLEALVTAGCVESLEHLILVGDHKQLRAHCTVKGFERKPVHLDVSMFERLFNNGIDFSMLQCQRRMIPEIRRNLASIYPDMTDHQSVLSRPKVPGMGEVRSYFFGHSWPESRDEHSSCCNRQEANMIVGFFNYLTLNGVKPERITVLTFYNGQRRIIWKTLSRKPVFLGRLNVKTVDSYQGEQNDIVLLSLVRNNREGNIGFLANENRVCVALSRARNGFFLFGNIQLLAMRSKLWAKVVKSMLNSPLRVGSVLPIKCTRHEQDMEISDPSFWRGNQGGCQRVCGEQLNCGHICDLKCHAFKHDGLMCEQDCMEALACGHRCSKLCSVKPCACRRCGQNNNKAAAQPSSNMKNQSKSQPTKGLYAPHQAQSNQRSPTSREKAGRQPKTSGWTNFAQRAAAGKLDEKQYRDKFSAKQKKDSNGASPSLPSSLLVDLDPADDDNSTTTPPSMPSHAFNIPLITDELAASTLTGNRDEGQKGKGRKKHEAPTASLLDMDVEIDEDIRTISPVKKEPEPAAVRASSFVTNVAVKKKEGKSGNGGGRGGEEEQKNGEQQGRTVWRQKLDYSSVSNISEAQQHSPSSSSKKADGEGSKGDGAVDSHPGSLLD